VNSVKSCEIPTRVAGQIDPHFLEKEGKKMKSSAAGGCTVEKEDRYLLLDTENQDGRFMENIICEMSEKKEFLRIYGWR